MGTCSDRSLDASASSEPSLSSGSVSARDLTADDLLPAGATVRAGLLFGALTVAWGLLAGSVLPGQPLANRTVVVWSSS